MAALFSACARTVALRAAPIASRTLSLNAKQALAPVSRLAPAVFAPAMNRVAVRFGSGGGPSKAEVEDRVLAILRCFDKINASKLTLDSHFVRDLGLDSLDTVECVMAIEDEFCVELPDEVAESIFTPREAAAVVMRVQPGPTHLKPEHADHGHGHGHDDHHH